MQSKEKSKIIPLSQYKTRKISVNGKEINICKEGKLLGLKIQTTYRYDRAYQHS